MTKKPEISVIMSVYNGQKYLEEAVLSIINQTFKNFEFLIVDDCSKDKTFSILKKFEAKDKRIKLFKNKTNIGLTKSLNKLIKLSEGKYIARMDADDISLPERFEKQIEYIKKTKSGVVGCNSFLINIFGKKIKKTCVPKKIKKTLSYKNCLVHGSLMFKSEVLKSYLYNEKLELAQDYELLLRLSKKHKISALKDFLYSHRIHKNSLSRKKMLKQMYYVVLAKKIGKNSKAPLFFYLITTFVYNYKCGLSFLKNSILI